MISVPNLVQSLVLCWAAATLMGGCASEPFVTKTIRARMEARPEDYRRVEILPIWLAGQAKTDASLTTNDLKALSRQMGTNLLAALTQALTDKGYEVVHTCRPLCTREDWEALDADVRRLLSEVRTNFLELSQEIYANRPNQKFKPCQYKADSSVAGLQKRLGRSEADVLVFLDSKAFLETPGAQHKRNQWNWTGGAILTPLVVGLAIAGAGGPELPLKSSPCWMAHTILIADARTLEVLFWNERTFSGEDARNAEAVKGKLRELVVDLAELPKPRSSR